MACVGATAQSVGMGLAVSHAPHMARAGSSSGGAGAGAGGAGGGTSQAVGAGFAGFAGFDAALDTRPVARESAVRMQSALRGAKARRRPELRPMTRVQVLLKGKPGLHRGLICWRGSLPGVGDAAWLGVALDKPLGSSDGERQGVRYFKCERSHGVFVAPSRARVEGEGDGAGASSSMDAAFDLSSDETDGSLSIGLSEDEDSGDDGILRTAAGGVPPPTGGPPLTGGPPPTGAPPGINRSGSMAAAAAAERKAKLSEPERLAMAIQNVYRGKKSREDTEDGQLKELFVMPPVTSTGQSIEELVGDDGIYHAVLTVGHDSNPRTGEWSVYLDVRGEQVGLSIPPELP